MARCDPQPVFVFVLVRVFRFVEVTFVYLIDEPGDRFHPSLQYRI